ncbi:MAG: T9SS type A sorting domain-containing protein [Bacteroidota bacterium]|nr:T9SS type A sorting domain-containing protein [Bacteroidota bacterium]
MKRIYPIVILLLSLHGVSSLYSQTPARQGWWKFDDAANVLKADVGSALELVGTHQAIAGPDVGNGAVKIGVGSYYKMYHGMSPNGGGAGKLVNEYTLMIDFRAPNISVWKCFFQTDTSNATDGDFFIRNTDATIGVGSTGYSLFSVTPNEWYRLVISVKNGTQFKYYIDGQIIKNATAQGLDGRFALANPLLIFADEDGEDTEIDCAELSVWNSALDDGTILTLGGFGHELDKTPPEAPTGVVSIGGGEGSYTNTITWTDVPDEPGSKYNVYFSEKSFTKIDSTIERLAPYSIGLGTQTVSHVLRSPVTDQNITYYYGVGAIDALANIGPVAVAATPVTTKAKGVPVISPTAPANFVADGSLSEWASILPIRLNAFGPNAAAHLVPGGKLTDSLDLSVKVYLAMDANNFYIAYDVVDDTVAVDTTLSSTWQSDAPDLNIGLYDWRGTSHAGYTRGAAPDYMLRFSKNRINNDKGIGNAIVMYPSANYVWKVKTLTPGYIVEAKIPFTTFAAIIPGDSVFVPKVGMRIPLDFSINDRDLTSGREAILSYSTLNNDNSWINMYNWTHTWIGNAWTTGVQRNAAVATTFELLQNYPNPFNPATNIKFSIPQSGMVSLKVFDILGREVMNIFNQFQEAGSYTVNFDASKLATGIYMYRLESGSFSSVKKMMLIK